MPEKVKGSKAQRAGKGNPFFPQDHEFRKEDTRTHAYAAFGLGFLNIFLISLYWWVFIFLQSLDFFTQWSRCNCPALLCCVFTLNCTKLTSIASSQKAQTDSFCFFTTATAHTHNQLVAVVCTLLSPFLFSTFNALIQFREALFSRTVCTFFWGKSVIIFQGLLHKVALGSTLNLSGQAPFVFSFTTFAEQT